MTRSEGQTMSESAPATEHRKKEAPRRVLLNFSKPYIYPIAVNMLSLLLLISTAYRMQPATIRAAAIKTVQMFTTFSCLLSLESKRMPEKIPENIKTASPEASNACTL